MPVEDGLTLTNRRWLIIAAGILANACCGAGYAFSVIKAPLMQVLERSDAEVSMAYSFSVILLPVGMLLGGWLSSRRGPRLAVAVGGLVFGAGLFASGFSQSLIWLYVTYGMMVSLGQGTSYGTVISVAVRWFPDRKGLASGLVVSALGVGTLVVAPLYQSIVGSDPERVLFALKTMGVAVLFMVLTASRFIVDPPKDIQQTAVSNVEAAPSGDDLQWRQMLRQPMFWMLFTLYVLGTFSGHMILTQASGMAQKTTGLTAAAAAVVVGIMGAANATGRFVWGWVSDRIGRLNTVAAMFAVTVVVMALLNKMASGHAGLIAGLVVVGLCYGGNLGTYPSICADAFGTRNMSINYAILFVAFSVAAVAGPRVGAMLLENTGGYSAGCTTAAALAGLGLLLSLAMKLRGRVR